jgi:hypothetical protein
MPKSEPPDLSPAARRHEIASTLACGVSRWRSRTRTTLPVPPESLENALEVPVRKKLSVPQRARGLSLRASGDNA